MGAVWSAIVRTKQERVGESEPRLVIDQSAKTTSKLPKNDDMSPATNTTKGPPYDTASELDEALIASGSSGLQILLQNSDTNTYLFYDTGNEALGVSAVRDLPQGRNFQYVMNFQRVAKHQVRWTNLVVFESRYLSIEGRSRSPLVQFQAFTSQGAPVFQFADTKTGPGFIFTQVSPDPGESNRLAYSRNPNISATSSGTSFVVYRVASNTIYK